MSRSIEPLYQITDHAGGLWNVRSERPTNHGWLLLIGRPAHPETLKNGRGGDRIIVTRELLAYMESMRMAPGDIDLPVCGVSVTNLRRALHINYKKDLSRWWDEHTYDLTAFQKDFSSTHGVCTATVARRSVERGIIHGPPRWTSEEKDLLRQLLEKKLPTKEIAAVLGKPAGSIKVARRRMIGNISTTKPWSEEDKAEALRLLAEGVKVKEIAKRTGRTKTAILAMRQRFTGPTRPSHKKWTEEEKRRLYELLEAGHTQQEISDVLGRSALTIRNFRQEFQRMRR